MQRELCGQRWELFCSLVRIFFFKWNNMCQRPHLFHLGVLLTLIATSWSWQRLPSQHALLPCSLGSEPWSGDIGRDRLLSMLPCVPVSLNSSPSTLPSASLGYLLNPQNRQRVGELGTCGSDSGVEVTSHPSLRWEWKEASELGWLYTQPLFHK